MGHLAHACKKRKTLHANRSLTRQKRDTPTHSGLPGGAGAHAQETSYFKKKPQSNRNPNGRRGWPNKRQKTQNNYSFDQVPTTGSPRIHTTPSMKRGQPTSASSQRGNKKDPNNTTHTDPPMVHTAPSTTRGKTTNASFPQQGNERNPNDTTHTPNQKNRPHPSAAGPDVKLDKKAFQCKKEGGDFMSRVKKGSRQLFIEEYPQAGSLANEGGSSGRNDELHKPNAPITQPTYIPQLPGGQNFFHDPAVSGVIRQWETDTGVTRAGEVNTGFGDTRKPRLLDDRPRFLIVTNRPMFFPTNPEWFHLGSYNAPLVRDVRKFAPLIKWSGPPGNKRDQIPCHTDQILTIATSAAVQPLQEIRIVHTYEDAMHDRYGQTHLR